MKTKLLSILKIVISKTLEINLKNNCDGPEPNPNLYDNHMPNGSSQVHKNPIYKMNTNDLYKNSLIYLFDYDKKIKQFYKRPRQVIPIAVFLMKNKLQQPPSSQLLRRSLSFPSPSYSTTASSSTSFLIESTEINYCKKSLLITTPSVADRNNTSSSCFNHISQKVEVETQTVNPEFKEAYVQTEEALADEEIISKSNDLDQELQEQEINYNCSENPDEIIKIECNLYEDDEEEQGINYLNDRVSMSPLPALSLLPEEILNSKPISPFKKNNKTVVKKKIIKPIKNCKNIIRILIKRAKKSLTKKLSRRNKTRKLSAKETLYSDISNVSSPSSTLSIKAQELPKALEKQEPPVVIINSIKPDENMLKIFWHNLYFSFIFLTQGILMIKKTLRDLDLIENHHNYFQAFKNLEEEIFKVECLKNPCDPSDKFKNFSWNYKSSKYYKLFKLKQNLILRLTNLYDYYAMHSDIMSKKPTSNADEIKIHCLNKLNDYIIKWSQILNESTESYRVERIKFEINDDKDLKQFTENSDTKFIKDQHNEDIDMFAMKLYYFLELIIMPKNTSLNEEIYLFKQKINNYDIMKALGRQQQSSYERNSRKRRFMDSNSKRNRNDSKSQSRYYVSPMSENNKRAKFYD